MRFINHQVSLLPHYQGGLRARLSKKASSLCDQLTGEENPTRLFGEIGLLVLLLHINAIAYLFKPLEQETHPKPLVMDVALISAPASPQLKSAPTLPPAQPKPRPTHLKPKKVKAIIKSVNEPAPKPAPMSKPESAPPVSTAAPSSLSTADSAAANSQPKSEIFTEANYRANYRSNPKPEYPHIARSRNWQGKVLLRVQVTADGHSAGVSVQQSSGHRQLDEAAIKAVNNWTFIPAKRGNTPVASTVTVPIQFKLNE